MNKKKVSFFRGIVDTDMWNFDIANLSINNSKLLSAQSSDFWAVALSINGDKLYIVDIQTYRIYQYTLSTNWDVTTAIYDSFFYVGAKDRAFGLQFNSSGTSFFFNGSNNDAVYKYNLSTPWDVTTAVYNSSVSISSKSLNSRGIHISSDGLKLYISDTNRFIYQYNLSTPWDITTAVYNSELNVPSIVPNSIYFSDLGNKLYIVDDSNDNIYNYNLSTPWDITTAVYNSLFSVGSKDTRPRGLYINPYYGKLYISGRDSLKVFEYNIN